MIDSKSPNNLKMHMRDLSKNLWVKAQPIELVLLSMYWMNWSNGIKLIANDSVHYSHYHICIWFSTFSICHLICVIFHLHFIRCVQCNIFVAAIRYAYFLFFCLAVCNFELANSSSIFVSKNGIDFLLKSHPAENYFAPKKYYLLNV